MPNASTIYIRLSASDLTLVRPTDTKPVVHRHRLNRRVSFTLNLREALATAPASLTEQIEQAEVYVTTSVVLVPLSEFNESDAQTHLSAAFRQEERTRVLYDVLPSLNTVLVFRVSDNLCHAIEEAFPKSRYHNALTPILQRGPQVLSGQHNLLAYVHEDCTDAILWEGNKLVALNTFTTKHADDAVFFILGMTQALGIDAASLQAYVVGEARKQKELVQALSRFVPQVEAIANTAETAKDDSPLPYPLTCALTFSIR